MRPGQTFAAKLASIDALRGYAVLLVIIVHTGGAMKELPYPLKKLTALGWYGVQLFFLASAVTLLISWSHGAGRPLGLQLREFFTRRFLRIAPMYYLAAAFYFVLRPPGEHFSLAQLAVNLGFLNAWNPDWMPTTDAWQVVPGGWSIGVEFSFYVLFPCLALLVTHARGALAFFLFACVLMLAAPQLGAALFPEVGGDARDNFLYFWLPNQLVVFSLGFVAYTVISAKQGLLSDLRRWLGHHVFGVIAAIVVVYITYSQIGILKFASTHFPWAPTHLVIAGVFAFGVIALIENPLRLFVFPFICRLGQYSFSAYCLHFGILDILPPLSGGLIDRQAGGVYGIVQFSLYLGLTLSVTYFLSSLTFRYVERPFIRLGHSRPTFLPKVVKTETSSVRDF